MRSKAVYILMVVLAAFAALSCERNIRELPAFSIDTDDVFVDCEGGEQIIQVFSSREWTAVSSEPWVMVSPANGVGATSVSVLVDTTLIKGTREAVVSFSSGGEFKARVKVSQLGFGSIIKVLEPQVKLEFFRQASERVFTAKILSNVEYDAVVEEGSFVNLSCSAPSFEAGSRPRSSSVKVSWQMNSSPEERTARISFIPRDPAVELETPAVLTIVQDAAPHIEDSRAGDSLAVVLINEMIGAMTRDDPSENMRNWQNVALWSALDKDLPCKEAVGRVRAVRFYMFSTEEGIPEEISHLKYLQTLDFYSNVNYDRQDIALGTAVCSLEHLKYLEVGAYGLTSLPDELVKLGGHLVTLNLNSNCFNSVPDILTPQNFPALRSLNLSTNRRIQFLTDLRNGPDYDYRGGVGLHVDCSEDDSDLRRLLLWENLEDLSLSYNCLEGSLPDFEDGSDGVRPWSDEDVQMWGGDTLQYLASERIPRVLPNARSICLNLNFFTGAMPRWLLYHPRLMEMDPEILIFNQQEGGRDSRGSLVQFSNEPANFEYYFEAFPKYRDKYTFSDEYED